MTKKKDDKKPKKKLGRKPFKPTEQERDIVFNLAKIGMPERSLCRVIRKKPISINTLRKYFEDELKNGRANGDGELLEMAHSMAIKGSVPMMIFLMKSRLGFSEKVINEHTGDGLKQNLTHEQIISRIAAITTTK